MCRNQVFVYPRVDQLIGTETIICPFVAPNSDLRSQVVVDLLHYILVFDDQFQGYHIAGGMNTLVGSGASHERRLLGIVGVGLGDGAGRDKGLEEVTFNCFLVMRSAPVEVSLLVAKQSHEQSYSCIPL